MLPTALVALLASVFEGVLLESMHRIALFGNCGVAGEPSETAQVMRLGTAFHAIVVIASAQVPLPLCRTPPSRLSVLVISSSISSLGNCKRMGIGGAFPSSRSAS